MMFLTFMIRKVQEIGLSAAADIKIKIIGKEY
jgi:hypothetical protein